MKRLGILIPLLSLCGCALLEQETPQDYFNEVFRSEMTDYVLHDKLPLKKFDINVDYCDSAEILETKIMENEIVFRTNKGNRHVRLNTVRFSLCPLSITRNSDRTEVINFDFITDNNNFIIDDSSQKDYIFCETSFKCDWDNKSNTIEVKDFSSFMCLTFTTYTKIKTNKFFKEIL